MGKKGVGFSLSQLSTAFLVLAVVIVALQLTHGMSYAADKFEEITGLDLGRARISSFDATPKEDGMEFKFTVPGSKEDAELSIYRSYEPTPGKEPATPQFDQSNRVFHAVGKGETGQQLALLFSGKKVAAVTCPKESGNGCESLAMPPGRYRFFAVLKKDGDVVDAKEVKVGFYTEDYVELMGDVSGCKAAHLKGLLGKKDRCSEGVKILYGDYVGLFGSSGGCSYPVKPVGHTEPLVNVDFTGCTASQVDDVWRKVSVAEFYRGVCEVTGGAEGKKDGIGALTDFKDLVSKLEKKGTTVDAMKSKASDDLMGCAGKASAYLNSLGWMSVGKPSRKAAHEKLVQDYLDGVNTPSLGSISLSHDDSGKVGVSWSVPVGKKNIGGFELGHTVVEAIDPVSNKVQAFSESFEKGPSENSFSHLTAPEHLAGWHTFIVRAKSKADGTYVSGDLKASLGFYNRQFVELYQEHPNGCTADGCNVIQKKKEFIKDSIKKNPESIKLSNSPEFIARLNGEGCVLDSSGALDDCPVPSAVNFAYQEIMEAVYPPAEQREKVSGFQCINGAAVCCEESSNPQGRVCKAKRELKEALDQKGWHRIVVDTPIVITPSDIKVQDFKVTAMGDGRMVAEWVLSGNTEKAKAIEIQHEFSRYAREGEGFVNVLPVQVDAGSKTAEIGPFDDRFDGQHRFRLKVIDLINYEIAAGKSKPVVGVYDQKYVELYDGGAKNCKGDGGCDVIGRKRSYLKGDKGKKLAKEVYDGNPGLRDNFATWGCDIGKIDSCRPEGVHALFAAVLDRSYPSKDQQAELLEGCDIKGNPYRDVCRARKNLRAALKANRWVEIVKRGATKDIVPTTARVVSTIPEAPIPGELFKMVVDVTSTHPLRWVAISKAGSKEQTALPCDWLGTACRREFSGLYFEPEPEPIRIFATDVTDREVELEPFTPVKAASCLENRAAGEKWFGCLGKLNEEVLYECNSDGSTTTIIADRDDDRLYASFLCGGFIDYGSEGEAGNGDCIYSCRFDSECAAAGGSIAPLECPSTAVGYGGVKLGQVCCEISAAQETNPKTIAVLSIAIGMMNKNIEANGVGGFFFILDVINPVKMFVEGSKAIERDNTLKVMEKLLADAEQGTHLSSVVGSMNALRTNKNDQRKFLDQKYSRIRDQFNAYVAKLEVDVTSNNEIVREKAYDSLNRLSGMIAGGFETSYILPQKEIDILAIEQSNSPLVLRVARYDTLTWNDDPAQLDELDDIYYELAKVFSQTGDDGLAIEFYTMVAEEFPGSEHAQDARENVQGLQSFGHKAQVLSTGLAVDLFGDPTFLLFGGPKALVKGGLSVTSFIAKTPQLSRKGAELSAPLIKKALVDSGIKSKEALERLPGILKASGGKLTKEAIELLKYNANRFRARKLVTSVDSKGTLVFETVSIETGKALKIPVIARFEKLAAIDKEMFDKLRASYFNLAVKRPDVMVKQSNQELAIKLLQGGLDEDDVIKVLTKAGKLADDDPALVKAVDNFLGPEFGITNPKVGRAVLAAKLSGEALEDAASVKRLASEFILTTGKNDRPYLMALTRDGKEVIYQFRSTLGNSDEVIPVLSGKYTAVMDEFPELLETSGSVRNVLKLVQRGFEPGEIGELLVKRGSASNKLKAKFVDQYLRDAYGVTERKYAERILDSGIDHVVVREVKAEMLARQNLAELLKERSVLLRRAGEGVSDASSQLRLEELASEVADAKALVAPGERLYDKGGKLVAVLGKQSGEVNLVPGNMPSFFNQLVVIKTRADDAIYAALRPLVASAEGVVGAAHTAAVDYAIPAAKIIRSKALDAQFRAVLAKRMALPAVSGIDFSKAYIQSARDFMASGEVAVVAVPVVVVNDDGTEELAFLRFEGSSVPKELVPETDAFYIPGTGVAECIYYDVLVECMVNDHVSRGSLPIIKAGNLDNYLLANLNMRNIEGFSMPKDAWLEKVVSPLAASLPVDVPEGLSEEEEDVFLASKANELIAKASIGYDAAQEMRNAGLTDLEVQSLLFGAKDLDSFNKLAGEPVDSLRGLA